MGERPWAAAGIILRKELLESLRDRKTLVIMVVLPLLLYPLVFIAFSQATLAQQERLSQEEVRLGLAGGPTPAALAEGIRALEAVTVVPVDDASAAVRSGEVLAALEVHPEAATRIERREQGALTVVFDGSSDRSRAAEARLRDAIAAFAEDVRAGRLEHAGLAPDYVEPVAVEANNIAPPERQGGWLLGQILPVLVSFLMIGSAFYPAVDLTAGEKERGTLQTLLTAPITPMAIVAGKFGAVVVLALMTGAVNLLSVALVAVSIPLPDELAAEFSFALGPATFLLLLVCLVLLGMMFGAVMMAVAVTARSFKDAQNYITPLYLLCIFPLMISSLPGVGLTAWTAALPVVNLALAMKQLLIGTWSVPLMMVVLVSSLVWTALGLVLAARVFSLETVLLGDEGLTAVLRRRPRSDRTDALVPTIGEAVTTLAVVLIVLFYGSLALLDAPVLTLIHVTQWGFLLAPAVALTWLLGLDPRATFALRRPSGASLTAAVLLGLGTWYVALRAMTGLPSEWVPVPSPVMQDLAAKIEALASDPAGAALLFLGAALGPALCEEALFRGVVLQSLLRRLPARPAVVLSAAVFALFHLNVHQLPTTFVVGLALGALVVVSGSIWPAVCLHLLHNGLALAAQLYAPEPWLEHPLGWALAGSAIAGVGLLVWLSRRGRPPRPT